MFISELTTSGAIPTLTATLQFAARRHELLAANVANLNTPEYQATDVDPHEFQRTLGAAIDRRRAATGGRRGELDLSGSRRIDQDRAGNLRVSPKPVAHGPLRHDRNNSDLDSAMQAVAENTMVYRVSAELLRSRMNHLATAINLRV
ncbi:MAG: flagellar basal body rod protein FlgB [Phycisphaeraceae bacterium]|nr:flagellar basal body rod protein FlgB [Phycisphaeraceae bacterium]